MSQGALEYDIEPTFIRGYRDSLEPSIDPTAQGYRGQHGLDVVVRVLERFLKSLWNLTL